MAAFQKFNQFIEDVYNGEHNLSTDVLKIALTNAANPPVSGNTVLTDLTTVSLANASTDTITTVSSTQTNGTYSLILDDLTVSASGGSIGPFQYVVIYNSANSKLIGYASYGLELTVADTQSFVVDFNVSLFTAI